MIRNLEQYYPQKLGVRYDPPAIVIQYVLVNQQKTMHHKILMPNLTLQSQILASIIRKQHPDYFYKDRITESNIRKLIQKLKQGKDANQRKRNQNIQKQRIQYHHNQKPSQQTSHKINDQKYIEQSFGHKDISISQNNKVQQQQKQQQKSIVSDNYYEEEFQDFEISQESKSRSQKSSQSIQKPADSPFEFIDEQVPVPPPPKFTKHTVPVNKPKDPISTTKPSVKEQPKVPKKVEPEVKVEQQILDDCFQFL